VKLHNYQNVYWCPFAKCIYLVDRFLKLILTFIVVFYTSQAWNIWTVAVDVICRGWRQDLLAVCSSVVPRLNLVCFSNIPAVFVHLKLHIAWTMDNCCAMLCKRGLCHHAKSVCCVVDSIEMNKCIFKIFHCWVATPF